ncbi:EAL domain-containing protein [Parashewanella spongiae]|uniref:EAL domain-containing protein n=1 Tax=Parashewanella spongiae TaxID=342950 RepID=A0A3A6TAD7_9GAMM|nr:EAL domain-containing protein [Parashewanella spongiae]MCL1080078.1 EAL domain-containing protein [Parashewanella spongiae]RJY05199.1 EAL domain-containing protein [Parashewanella spongiae]
MLTVLCFAACTFVIEFISAINTEKQHLTYQQIRLIQSLEQSSIKARPEKNLFLAEKLLDQSLSLPWIQSVQIELSNGGKIFSANKTPIPTTSIIIQTINWLLKDIQSSSHLLYKKNAQQLPNNVVSPEPFARITLNYDTNLISAQLYQHLKYTFLISLSGAIALTLILSYVFHRFLTLPIIKLSEAIDAIHPDSPKESLLPKLPFHEKNELGSVISKFNQILIQFDTTQLKLRKLATKDSLTGLPNRTLFLESISYAIQRARSQRRSFSIYFVDIDRFKNVNDSLGHALGDRYLTRIARVLKRVVGEKGTVARLSGDEFTILANEVQTPTQAAEFAEKLIKQINKPLQLNEHQLHPNASIGISTFPDDGHTPEDLIRHADTAMYSAKSTGLGKWAFFNTKMTDKAVAALKIEADLHHALNKEQLELHFQPKINLMTGDIVGVEALMRWRNGEKLISPGVFIPIAEESGLIVAIGQWVIKQTCMILAEWRKNYNNVPPIAINIASKQFVDPKLVSQIKQQALSRHVPSHLIEIEITESSFINDIQFAIAQIEQLTSAGFKVAIDDFGTGYSSLSYLKLLPINTLKIDRAFIEGLPENDAIASTILMLGKQMKLDIVAEGIDEKKQLNWLKEKQCPIGQGYLFSKPLPKEQFEKLYMQPKQESMKFI